MKKTSVFPLQETPTLTINFFENRNIEWYSQSDEISLFDNDKLILGVCLLHPVFLSDVLSDVVSVTSRGVNDGDRGMHPQTFWQGVQCLSSPPPLTATNLCQSSQCHIQLSLDCHSSCMTGDIWRWCSSTSHFLEDRLLKLANTICYINEQGC